MDNLKWYSSPEFNIGEYYWHSDICNGLGNSRKYNVNCDLISSLNNAEINMPSRKSCVK